jgi:predicted RNA-binding protein with TRAM domain
VMVPPKFATPRNPERRTLGTRQGHFARIWLGKPLFPYQQEIADVAGELHPDGRPVYDLVVVTMQRQAGKSHLCMARAGERCMCVPNFRSFYTAQTGGDAQDQFLKFNDEIVKGSALEDVVKTRRGNGKADMTFPNGSTIRPLPPGENTGHGKQSDLYDVDEAWAFDEEQGKAILQAIAPTQLTRPRAQVWIWSAGGTAASTWLASLVARGRAGDPSLAYFEWGVPDDLDMDDLDAVAAHHPANGHLITVDSLASLRAKLDDPAEFARAAGNRWTEVIGGAIDWNLWTGNRWDVEIPEDAPVGYGAARAADGQHVVIAAAADVDGVPVVEIVDVVPVYGAAEVVKFWAARAALVVDPTGPSAGLHDELTRLKVPLLPFTGRDASAACLNVLDALGSGAYRYRKHDALDAAVRVAGTRTVGDGGKAWARLAAGAPIAALEAATDAIWALSHRPPARGKPRVRFAA